MSAGRIDGPTSNRNSTRIVYDESREIQKKKKSRAPMGDRKVDVIESGFCSLMALVFWTKLRNFFFQFR